MSKNKSINKGKLEVICGSMFSGKSEELISRLKRAELAQLQVCAFKPRLDDRITIEYIHSHSGNKFKVIALENPEDIIPFLTDDISIIGIDEVQFFPKEIIKIIIDLVDSGRRVITAGLDLDFRGIPFGHMPTLMAIADKVTKLKAVCIKCGKDAHFTQRLIDGKAAKFDDPIILIGAQECYQARCRDCYVIDKTEWPQTEISL